MNKEHIQSNPCLRNIVFFCCGLFGIKGALRGEAGRLFDKKALSGLWERVVLPSLGLVYRFSAYSIPYEWLNAGRMPGSGADEEEAGGGPSTSVSHYNQHNTIRIFGCSPFHRLLVSKSIWNISQAGPGWRDRHWPPRDPSRQESADKEGLSVPYGKSINGTHDLVRTDVVELHAPVKQEMPDSRKSLIFLSSADGRSNSDQDGGSVGRIGESIALAPMKVSDKKRSASAAGRSSRKADAKGSKSAGRLLRKLLGTSAAARGTGRIDANTTHTPMVQRNTSTAYQASPNTVLQQESVQRIVGALATKSVNYQREYKADISSLQQQLKEVEQLNSRDMRRLERSLQELMSMLSTRKQPVSFSSPKAPSLYGRLK